MTAVETSIPVATATPTPTSAPSATGTVATAGGGALGVLIAVAGVVGNFTKHGTALANGLTVLGGSGLSIGALWALVKHHKPVERVEAWAHSELVQAEGIAQHLEPQVVADVRGLKMAAQTNKPAIEAAEKLVSTDFPTLAQTVGQVITRVEGLEAKVTAAVPATDRAAIETEVRRLVLPQVVIPADPPIPVPTIPVPAGPPPLAPTDPAATPAAAPAAPDLAVPAPEPIP